MVFKPEGGGSRIDLCPWVEGLVDIVIMKILTET